MSESQNAWVVRVLGVDPAAASSPTAPPGEPGTMGTVAYAKSRLTWLAMRKKVDADFEVFVASVAEQYKDDGQDKEVGDLLRARLTPVLAVLDDELADKLDEAGNETDATKRAGLVGEARALIERYRAYVTSDQTLAAMDANPFAPTAIQQTMVTTLQSLSTAIR